MKRIALLTIALLTATNAFAMSEQAKGSIDAATTGLMYMSLNKHCNYVPQAALKAHVKFVADFADEFVRQYPDYANKGIDTAYALDGYLKVAPKAEKKVMCKQFKNKVMNWYNDWQGEGEENDG